jgi:hypothetical protein
VETLCFNLSSSAKQQDAKSQIERRLPLPTYESIWNPIGLYRRPGSRRIMHMRTTLENKNMSEIDTSKQIRRVHG